MANDNQVNGSQGEVPGRLPLERELDLELDLLVDEELPEERRRELLKSLDRQPAHWRDLSIRFLERQVERKSARQLLAQGIVKLPQRPQPAVRNFSFPRRGWWTAGRMMGMAAGLLIAITGGLVVNHMLTRTETSNPPLAKGDPDTVYTKLPTSVVGTEIPVRVSVVNMRDDANAAAIFSRELNDGPGSRRSIVIKPDGSDNMLVIPVRNLQIQ